MKKDVRKCPFCGEFFLPDRRIKRRQICCGKEGCKRKRKMVSQKRWVEKNPGYFRGRYYNTKAWLKAHPGYLRRYKATHPEYVEKNRVDQRRRDAVKRCCLDIQDKINAQMLNNTGKSPQIICADHLDIQDEISPSTTDIIKLLLKIPCLDIQDKNDLSKNLCYNVT